MAVGGGIGLLHDRLVMGMIHRLYSLMNTGSFSIQHRSTPPRFWSTFVFIT